MITWAAARNCAFNSRYIAATLPRFTTRKSAPWIGLRRTISPRAEATAMAAMAKKTAVCTLRGPVGGDGHRRPRLPVGSGGLEREEHLLRVDHPVAAVRGELQDARVHPDRVFRAGLDTVAAEHALAEVDEERLADLFDLGVGIDR